MHKNGLEQEIFFKCLRSEGSSGGGAGTPLQYSCPENPMDRGAWRVTVHGVAKSWTWVTVWAHSEGKICRSNWEAFKWSVATEHKTAPTPAPAQTSLMDRSSPPRSQGPFVVLCPQMLCLRRGIFASFLLTLNTHDSNQLSCLCVLNVNIFSGLCSC